MNSRTCLHYVSHGNGQKHLSLLEVFQNLTPVSTFQFLRESSSEISLYSLPALGSISFEVIELFEVTTFGGM